MKHLKLNYTVEVGSKLTTLFIYLNISEVFSEKTQHTLKMADANEHTLFQ